MHFALQEKVHGGVDVEQASNWLLVYQLMSTLETMKYNIK